MGDLTKLEQFMELREAYESNLSLKEGEHWFAVSFKWWRQWEQIEDYEDLKSCGLGPVDNTEIYDKEYDGLKQDTQEISATYLDDTLLDTVSPEISLSKDPVKSEYLTVNTEMWNLLNKWYGVVPTAISAPVQMHSDELFYDFFPARFTMSSKPTNREVALPKIISFSKFKALSELKVHVAKLLDMEPYEFRLYLKQGDKTEWQLCEMQEECIIDALPKIGVHVWDLLVEKLELSQKKEIINAFSASNVEVDQVLDAKKNDGRWYEARIANIITSGKKQKLVIHFLSFDPSEDEVHDTNSDHLQPPYTRVEDWRSKLQVGSKLEVHLKKKVGRRESKEWTTAVVQKVCRNNAAEGKSIQVEQTCVQNQQDSDELHSGYLVVKLLRPITSRLLKANIKSESIAPPGTHCFDSFGYEAQKKKAGNQNADGIVGLENLGNTCYMNSMMQCLSSTTKLVEYFLGPYPHKEPHTYKINRTNPLGTGGKLAIAYGKLQQEIWHGKYEELAPITIKREMSRAYPMFQGYHQHDAHEFFSLFLDSLHEDLNLIKDKPRTSIIESKGRPDDVVAELSWKNYLLRNQSIIVDTFMGLMKSKLTCPNCQNVSTKFDTFSSLSVPIPRKNNSRIHVVLLRLGGNARRLSLDLNAIKTASEIAAWIEDGFGIDRKDLVLAELSLNRIYNIYYMYDKKNEKIALRPDAGLDLIAYELDSNEPEAENNEETENHKKDEQALIELQYKIANHKNKHVLFRATDIMRLHADAPAQDIREAIWNHVKWMFKRHQGEIAPHDYYGLFTIRGTPSTLKLSGSRNNIIVCKLKEAGVQNLQPAIRSNPPRSYFNPSIEDRNRALNLGKIIFTSIPGSIHNSSNGIALESCFEAFQEDEELGKNDTWYCASCKNHVQARKKMDIWNTGNILCIHLNRFKGIGHHREKLSDKVDFPICNLSLSKYILDQNAKSSSYDLFAVCNHMGTMAAGHYTATVKRGEYWYYMNDRVAHKIDEANICSSNAYVLFYRRKEASA